MTMRGIARSTSSQLAQLAARSRSLDTTARVSSWADQRSDTVVTVQVSRPVGVTVLASK